MSIEAMKQALEALEGMYIEGFTQDNSPINNAITAIREALAEQPTPPPECQTEAEKTAFAFGWFKALEQKRKDEQPAQQQKEGFASPGGGYVPAIPRPMPPDWKLVPRKATPEMLKAMDECAQEGYDERLYAGMASSVYMAAWDASPVMGTLPEQPAQQEPVAVGSARCPRCWEPITPQPSKPWVGLTLGEAVEIWTKTKQLDTVIKLVEAKLKEKNA